MGRFLNLAFFYFTAWDEAVANPGGSIFEMMVPMALVFGIFYVLVIRPQQQKVKAHQESLAALKKGDEVVVGGGFIGHVDKIDGEDLYVRMNQDVVMKCVRSTVTQIRDRTKLPSTSTSEPKAKAKSSTRSKKQEN